MPKLTGIGLGLRRDFISEFLSATEVPDFIEIAPENWMGFGGRHAKQLNACLERAPLMCHGLSLSIGGPHPLNLDFVHQIKKFLKQHDVMHYSEHLSYTNDGGYLYDLMPIPMTEAAVKYVAERILRVQDILGRKLVIENVSTYLMPNAEMSESDFICEVVKQADCELLLDVNNVYVNSVNHATDAFAFIQSMPQDKIRYMHIAGHEKVSENLLIDTHGSTICDAVWALLEFSYNIFGSKPTLLERDFNIPHWDEIQFELNHIQQLQNKIQQASRQRISHNASVQKVSSQEVSI